MDIKLTNRCKNQYKPDQVQLARKILDKIPPKYLIGLREIIFYDDSANPVAQYQIGDTRTEPSKFHIFVGGFSKRARFSRSHFNFLLNGLITDHIVLYLQPRLKDTDILAIKRNRINHPERLSFGLWTPLYRVLTIFGFFYRRYPLMQGLFKKGIDMIERDLERLEKDSNKIKFPHNNRLE